MATRATTDGAAAYDPGNLFRHNLRIPLPGAA